MISRKLKEVARRALFSLWNRRSPLSLLGNTINIVGRFRGSLQGRI